MASCLCYISLAILLCGCACNDVNITSLGEPLAIKQTFDLSTYDETNKTTHTFLNYLDVPGDINIEVVNASVNATGGFFVIQLHSFRASCNLSNEYGDSVTGKDTGLVQVDLKQDVVYRYYISCSQESSENVRVLVAVIVYQREDPIPGGCNLTFSPEISSYQNVTYTDSMVQVDLQIASVDNATCDKNPVQTEMYHLYMREQTLDEKEYFDTIIKVLTVDDIVTNAYNISKPEGVQTGRRYYSAYLGTGTVYAAVARYNSRTSAYIPAVSYACDTDNWDLSCVAPTTIIWKMITALILFIGAFSLFAGHLLFRVQSWITGFVVGFYIGYIVAGLIQNISVGENVTISVVCGVIVGVAWSILWLCIGSPVLSTSLPVLFVAYISCCLLFYSNISDHEFIRGDINYWGTFIIVMTVFLLPLMTCTKFFHILACSVLGSSGITFAINHYAGGNLHYVFVNNFRRSTVKGFSSAVIDPVFQYTDVLLSVMWLVLLGIGTVVQLKTTQNGAPFPPPYERAGPRFLFVGQIFRRRGDYQSF